VLCSVDHTVHRTHTNSSTADRSQIMQITYDTETDRISSPDLDAQQTAALQAELSAALRRNDPVRTVAASLLQRAREGRA
jgi:hypothetical protein